MKDIFYDINDFRWSKADNSFYGEANYLYSLGDHSSAFPNGKNKFYIKNFKTNDFRRFEFEKEIVVYYESPDKFALEEPVLLFFTVEEVSWQFKSEDGILCEIALP